MKCINNELIQKYIDGEATIQEAGYVGEHIAHCLECARKIKEHEIFVLRFRKNLNSLNEGDIDIPVFEKPDIRKGRLMIDYKKYLYAAVSAVACIIILVIFLFPKDTLPKENPDVVLLYDFNSGFDANKPFTEQDMTIYMIDPDGNIVEL